MKQVLIYTICMGALLSSCNVYKRYSRPDTDVQGLYRDPVSAGDTLVSDTSNMGNLPWEKVFTDPHLQTLIRQGLEQNSDLQTALLKVKEAEAGLMSSRLAYLPSLGLSPQGTVSSFDKAAASQTYTLPAVASWEVDLFGKLTNAKRGAKAALLQSEAYRQAVQTQVISSIANSYYTLLMLDRQLAITEETAVLWRETVETMKAMKEAGMVNEAAVVQSEANSYMIAASIPDIKKSIREAENALCLLLKQAPQRVERGRLEDQSLPSLLNAGVPVQLLANRPDVKAAEMALAGTFYNTNQARSAFYPQISISGTLGWTNNSGMGIVNPGKMIATAVGSLTQPLFNRGALTARLRVAKAQQEEALIAFEQAILNAGSEVSNALVQYQTAKDKIVQREKQIISLEKSVEYTQELLTSSTATYLEVLTAEQSLLNAQLTGVSDEFQRVQAVVNLYRALGGGRN
ncbi:efflux transporter outer membrane subunit [Butyricimonas paravirosa]|uniref:efflux transporter outer membrane subunit n=1 Tax=Butyricimonas paravirosa TaxID=1472417 RepID=UPI00210D735F|nr:TolC family protein [Butyricimonas paravirosa]MCQ4874428.1 TolC family protein [Butyricimonas paravirosa]